METIWLRIAEKQKKKQQQQEFLLKIIDGWGDTHLNDS